MAAQIILVRWFTGRPYNFLSRSLAHTQSALISAVYFYSYVHGDSQSLRSLIRPFLPPPLIWQSNVSVKSLSHSCRLNGWISRALFMVSSSLRCSWLNTWLRSLKSRLYQMTCDHVHTDYPLPPSIGCVLNGLLLSVGCSSHASSAVSGIRSLTYCLCANRTGDYGLEHNGLQCPSHSDSPFPKARVPWCM